MIIDPQLIATYKITNLIGSALVLEDWKTHWILTIYDYTSQTTEERAQEILVNAHQRGYMIEHTSGGGTKDESPIV